MTQSSLSIPRQPTIFIPHGGGPWPFFEAKRLGWDYGGLEKFLRGLYFLPGVQPRAVLCISAHWEEESPTLQSGQNPPLLYDYSGFPSETYQLSWPAQGAPQLAERIRSLLFEAGHAAELDEQRGYDHGTFVATMLADPEARVPTLQLSLTRDLSAERLYEIGRALTPLRDEGVLLLGSGYSYHNMRGFFSALSGDPQPSRDARAFGSWLQEILAQPERRALLLDWEKGPAARACHPREEHLLPLMVCAGAAEGEEVSFPYEEELNRLFTFAARFG